MPTKPQRSGKEVRIVRLGVYLPEDLHKALMHRFIDEDVSATKLVEQLIREYVEKSPKKGG